MVNGLKSKSVFLYDVTNKRVVFEKNPDMRLPFASIVKVITVILAIEKCPDPENILIEMEERVIKDVLPYEPSLSALSLYPGKKFPVLAYIYASLLTSCCASARQLALYVGDGDIRAYSEKASTLLHKLNCKDTKVIEPTGLIDEDQYSTAGDIYRFFSYAMENPLFSRIVSDFGYRSVFFPSEIICTTNNLIRPDRGFFNAYVIGGKTGTTDEAGRCLVCAFERKGKSYVLITLGFPFTGAPENREQFYREEINPLIFSAFKEEGDFVKIELPFHIKKSKPKDEFMLEPVITLNNTGREIKYTFVSENENVAKVDNNGRVMVNAPGFTQIEVITDTGDYDICYVDSREQDRRIRTPEQGRW